MQLDTVLGCPLQNMTTRKLRAVVHDDSRRQSSPLESYAFEFARHAARGNREVSVNHGRLAVIQIDDGQVAHAALADRVVNEVHRPVLVQVRGLGRLESPRDRHAGFLAAPNLQLCGGIDPKHPFVIGDNALAAKQDIQPPVTPSSPFRCKVLQAIEQMLIVLGFASVSYGFPMQVQQPANAPFTEGESLLHSLRCSPSLRRLYQFFEFTNLSASLSRDSSATLIFRRRFSSSSCLRRAISLVLMPPYFAFQLRSVFA